MLHALGEGRCYSANNQVVHRVIHTYARDGQEEAVCQTRTECPRKSRNRIRHCRSVMDAVKYCEKRGWAEIATTSSSVPATPESGREACKIGRMF